ncbi:hypothetical protein FHV99_004587 [Ochrobactrum sp. P20RRXII]|nr:AAA family ATPase [Ochrobactrum sp. P20RRXII]NIH77335.1 hypothetical protein [Ochrobactrum sp. P20RRXII]
MLIGISGAHGCGKTTLAKQYATQSGLEYIPASTNEIAKRAGYAHGSVDLDINERIKLQWSILEGFKGFIRDCPANTVTDRTPLDVAAYTMAEIGMHSTKLVDPAVLKTVPALVREAQELTKKRFQHVTLLRPLPTYDAIDGKRPPANEAFQMHYQFLLEGLAFATHMSKTFTISLCMTNSLEARLEMLSEDVADVIERNGTHQTPAEHVFVH